MSGPWASIHGRSAADVGGEGLCNVKDHAWFGGPGFILSASIAPQRFVLFDATANSQLEQITNRHRRLGVMMRDGPASMPSDKQAHP